MKVAPVAPQFLIDYIYFCDLVRAGFEPREGPDLRIMADNSSEAFIRAAVTCSRPYEHGVPSSPRIRHLRRAFLGW